MNTLRTKTLRDMWLYKARTALVVLAIAVGTAAAGVATTSFFVLRGDLRDGYRATNPAHAILSLAAAPGAVDEALAGRAAELPEVSAAEMRRLDMARLVLPDGEERPLQLWTLPAAPTIGALFPRAGAPIPPPPGTLLLERSAAPVLGIAAGDTVTVELSSGEQFRLPVAGLVNDLAVPPTTVQPGVYAYIDEATAGDLGLPADFNQLYLTVAAAVPDRAAVETTVTAVTEWLADDNIMVTRAAIPEPGVHLMQGNVDTGLLMISILGGLTLLLSAFLVTNVMSAVIAQQVPVIGVLKALGSTRGLVLRQYGRMVILFGLMALALAVPLGLVGAWFMSDMLAGQLNFDTPSFGLPWQTLLVQLTGALLIPMLAALGPVRSAAGMTIRDALYPVQETASGAGGTGGRRTLQSYFASRTSQLIAWRNVARRKLRLALTLIALSLAGAMFIATFGLRLGLHQAIEVLVGEFPYAIQIDFAEPESARRIEQEAAAVDGLSRVEAWGVADARRVYPDGRVGSSFTLFGVPPTTQIAPFANRDGQWLFGPTGRRPPATGDPEPSLYINYETEKLAETPQVGDTITLKINGSGEQDTRLVGISLRPFSAEAFMPLADFERLTGSDGQANRLVAYMATTDAAAQATVAADLAARYEAAGMTVLRVETAGGLRDGFTAQFNTLIVLLMSLAGMTALVGGLGLANTMAINVLERSREIGILRSMGAERRLLRSLVLAEGLAVALISAVLAVVLALPLTAALDRVMGNSLLGSPLAFAFSPAAALGWLGLVLVIGLVACWVPAEAAARMTIRAALAYE